MVALITGASAGIGRELALLFAHNGYDVVLAARREDLLQQVAREISQAGRKAHVIAADLGVPDGVRHLHDHLQRERIEVDVLVNNAGFGLRGQFADLPLDRQLDMIQLNVVSLTALTRLLLPPMLTRNRGGVLNVASTAAFQPGPLMTVYYATKAYVLSFSEAIAEEVAGSALKITCLAPGPTSTEFANRAKMTGTKLFKGPVMNADVVARMGFDGWNAGRRLVIPGFRNKLGALVVRFSPRALVPRVIKGLNTIE
jgi:short-subunit dehydrogenase